MTLNNDNSHYQDLIEQVGAAFANKKNLVIRGGGSKNFYGRSVIGEILETTNCSGIVSYEPTELVITARAGTAVSEIEKILSTENQMLPFEPPHFGNNATVGGMIASGLSGPRRPYAGAVRDFVLGITCLTGTGKCLSFGGQVMKNVAGYDVSRLMVGALGALGVLLDVSIKLLPKPETEIHLVKNLDENTAISLMNDFAGKPIPLSGASYADGLLHIRLSGTEKAIKLAQQKLEMDIYTDEADYWQKLREHELEFFTSSQQPLWRIVVPPSMPSISLPGNWLVDWGGAQRWLVTGTSVAEVRETVSKLGGHATLFRGGDKNGDIFQPLAPALELIHKRLKQIFDPEKILNKGRMYKAI